MNDGYLSNHFLVSMPSLDDSEFSRTVSLICQHNAEGAFGIIINRPSETALSDIYHQFGIPITDLSCTDIPVFEGGPVHREFGLFIHSRENEAQRWESTHHLSETLSITSSKDIMHDIAQGAGPKHVLMSLGYAGWGPGQLENEIRENAWFSTPIDRDILFDTEFTEKWSNAAKLIGLDINKLSQQYGHA